jgi:hypothetical protein
LIASVLHRAAGLIVAADRPLPGFEPLPPGSHASADVRIHLGTRAAWHAAAATPLHDAGALDATGRPIVAVSRSAHGFHFTYAEGTRAWIDSSGANVWCTWPATASLDDTCTYLYGPILGLLLRIRGALAFHASAVQMGEGAVGFVGPRGAGKSTLAAALAAAGCPVVTDDILHVRRGDRRWLAEPFAAMLKLWPDGALLALGESVELPVIAAGWDKRALVPGARVSAAAGPLPLLALACLGPSTDVPAIEPLPAATALLQLAGNSSACHLLDRDARAAEFRALSDLVRAVPCVTLSPPGKSRQYPSFVRRVYEWGRARGLATAV